LNVDSDNVNCRDDQDFTIIEVAENSIKTIQLQKVMIYVHAIILFM